VKNGKGHILIADDAVYARALRGFLELYDYEVLTAQHGQAAIRLAASQKPDLILLGVEMPDTDGYVVCRRIREFSTVPIFMLSTLVRRVELVKGLGAGADGCISKVFDTGEFLVRIRAALQPVR
jgi:DNA-binding response OmpR family regulator